MSRFYTTAYGRCDVCGQPATKEVRGPHNARYGQLCSKVSCEKKRLKGLENTHAKTQDHHFPRS